MTYNKITLQPLYSHFTLITSPQGYLNVTINKGIVIYSLIYTMISRNLQSSHVKGLRSLLSSTPCQPQGELKLSGWTTSAETPNDFTHEQDKHYSSKILYFPSINQHYWFVFDR